MDLTIMDLGFLDSYAKLFKVDIAVVDKNHILVYTSSPSALSLIEETTGRVSAALQISGEIIGWLYITCVEESATDLELALPAIRLSIEAACSAMLRDKIIPNSDIRREQMLSLLLGKEANANRKKIQQALRANEIDEAMSRSIICIDLDFKTNKYFNINLNLGYMSAIESMRLEILNHLKENKYLNTQDILGWYSETQIVIAKSFVDGKNRSRVYLALDKICEDIAAELSVFPLLEFHIAYGNLYSDIYDLSKSYKEAQEILHLCGLRHISTPCCNINNIAMDVICQSLHIQILHKNIIPMLQCLEKDNGELQTDLLDCVETFVDCCMNYSATAQQAFMHRNTIKGKVERFNALTGLNPAECFFDALTVKLMAVYVRQQRGDQEKGADTAGSQEGGKR